MKLCICTLSVLLACVPPNVPSDAGGDAGEDASVDATTDVNDAPEVLIMLNPTREMAVKVCANLAALNCGEAFVRGEGDCTRTIEKMQSSGRMDVKPACLIAAKTPAQVRKCGTVRCTPVL